MRCTENLPPTEIRRRIKRARRFEDSRIYEVAFYLSLIDKNRLYVQYGFANVTDFGVLS